jgi:dTDP-4-amino-4,6-dideoxygalactose transaminase
VLPAAPVDGGDHVYHLFVVRAADRDGLREGLAARGIASAVHYPVAVHRTEAYAHLGFPEGSLPVAEEVARDICSLPIFPGMDADDVAAVAAAVAEVSAR